MLRLTTMLIMMALLSACEGAAAPATQESQPAANAVIETAGIDAVRKCENQPTLLTAKSNGGTEWPAEFGSRIDQVRSNFDAAFIAACTAGYFDKDGFQKQETLYLVNAPDANVEAIFSAEEGYGFQENDRLLEYPFRSDRQNNVPSVDDLKEAMFCAFVGAEEEEQERNGRCLVD